MASPSGSVAAFHWNTTSVPSLWPPLAGYTGDSERSGRACLRPFDPVVRDPHIPGGVCAGFVVRVLQVGETVVSHGHRRHGQRRHLDVVLDFHSAQRSFAGQGASKPVLVAHGRAAFELAVKLRQRRQRRVNGLPIFRVCETNLESIALAGGGKGASDELIRHFHLPNDGARASVRGREDTVLVGDVRHGRPRPPLRIVLEIRGVFPDAVIDRVRDHRGIARHIAVIFHRSLMPPPPFNGFVRTQRPCPWSTRPSP